jgi:hypothetical protein
MSELDDLRSQNKELKRLLANALGLLEKSKLFLASQAQSPPTAKAKQGSTRGKDSKAATGKVPSKKKRAVAAKS